VKERKANYLAGVHRCTASRMVGDSGAICQGGGITFGLPVIGPEFGSGLVAVVLGAIAYFRQSVSLRSRDESEAQAA
jgi:hypothetical protein